MMTHARQTVTELEISLVSSNVHIMSVRLIELSVEDEHEVYSSPVCDCRVDEISDTVRGPKAPYY